MKKRKTLQDLTIKDDFMFGAVMRDEENCKGFLEMVLGFPIAKVVVSEEKGMIYHPEYKGVRLDIYAEDEHHTHYNVEMQTQKKRALEKRSRYYHSQMVMEVLESGEFYEKLPDTFVIFVCDFDPFGRKRYCYTFRNVCKEEASVELRDGSCTIFLSTKGKNEAEVSPEMVRFLKFVTADLAESEGDFQDELVQKFQNTIRKIKIDREMGERFMTFEELLREEKQDGKLEAKQEDILELLENLGEVSEELRCKIENLESLDYAKALFQLAIKADSLNAFEEDAAPYFISEDEDNE